MLVPLSNANTPHLEKIFLQQHLWDIPFENPLDASVRSLEMQEWQHVAPKLYIKLSTTSITILFNTNVIKAVKWREMDNSNELFPFTPGANRASRTGTTCLKEMGQYLALDLMKILQLQM